MSSKDEETGQLDSTSPAPEQRAVWTIRWLSPAQSLPYAVLDKNRLTIGRGEEADLPLEATATSRVHAVLTRQGPVYSLADESSTNGTFVNGERVRHVALAENDVVRLGDVLGVVTRVPRAFAVHPDFVTVGGALFGPGLRRELDIVQNTARTTLPVVVVGETGVGKEAISRAIHELSGRTGPFHAVNCAALPPPLAEAELFGHRKGAYTGADQPGIGHLRAAHGGTLLLDELADLNPVIQAKLLRALQDSEIVPLGETRATSVDLRVVAACQRPLDVLVREGRLREDLAMRLNGISLAIPPLRERRIDIALLVGHLLDRWGGGTGPSIDVRALERILLQPWLGNVRELEHTVRKLLALHPREQVLRRSMLPFAPSSNKASSDEGADDGSDDAKALSRNAHDLERLIRALRENGGTLSAAASAAGISRQRAYRLLDGRSVEELLREG